MLNVFCLKSAVGVSKRASIVRNMHAKRDLPLQTPVTLQGLRDVVDKYDVFLLDQFGVIHDGVKPLPGVPEALELLRNSKKTTVILSNTSSRRETAERSFTKRLGLPAHHKDFITSGQVAWHFFDQKYRGKKCTWITWRTHEQDDFLKSLDIELSRIKDADFLFLHGTQAVVSKRDSQVVTDLVPFYKTNELCSTLQYTLSVAAKRKIPAICANVDLSAKTGSRLGYMPGGLMQHYRALGGDVIAFGKPYTAFFETAIRRAFSLSDDESIDTSLLRRVVHIGDSLHHDIAGARGAGVDSILITDHGVHSQHLQQAEQDAARGIDLVAAVCNLCDQEQVPRPTYVMKSFVI
eukprot:gene29373-35457_t